jgi:hypothetical protein
MGRNHKSRGLKGRPAGHTLSWFRPGLGGYIQMLVQKRIMCLRVSRNREEWPAGHVDRRPTVHHLQTNLIKLVEAPLYPYIKIPEAEFNK